MTVEVRFTPEARRWVDGLRDTVGRSKVLARLRNIQKSHFGDVSPVGEGVSELRIHYGPGYRVYFIQRGPVLVVILCGGDKGSQQHDIVRAKALASEVD